MDKTIPLSFPHFIGKEKEYLKTCIDTGWVSSAGSFVTRFEREMEKYTGSRNAVACMNGTAGLHLTLKVVGVRPEDYVIAPNLTFVATINAIKHCGGDPILLDADQDTWQMDLDLLENFLGTFTMLNENDDLILKKNGRRIRAILPVHVLGNMVDMERLQFIAGRFKLRIVEDATEAMGSRQSGIHAGAFGHAGVFSFNGNKIITTGGGGAIITNDEDLANRARHLAAQAKSDTDEYIHDDIGYNYRMTNLQAAIGLAQMEQLSKILSRKREIDRVYRENLSDILPIRFQSISEKVKPNFWLFTAWVPLMRKLGLYLKDHNIETRPLWVPMNRLPMYKDAIYINRDDKSDQLYFSCISLPSSPSLSDEDQMRIIRTIKRFYELNPWSEVINRN